MNPTTSTPPARTVKVLMQLCRRHVAEWLGPQPDPHGELLTLVWGPRFDRQHARALLVQAGTTGAVSTALAPARFALWQAGLLFDQLPAAAQDRVRALIVRHQSLSPWATPWETMPHGPHIAD